MDKEKKQDDTEQAAMLGHATASVPKFSTAVNFNKLDNGNIVISFFSQTFPTAPVVLIETLIVDEKHAEEIVKILQEVIDKTI